jgi:hypothetical protein
LRRDGIVDGASIAIGLLEAISDLDLPARIGSSERVAEHRAQQALDAEAGVPEGGRRRRRSCSLHVDSLVRAPRSYRGNGWLANPVDANAGVLPACCRVRLADDFPLPGLVDEAVTDPKLHRQDAARGRRCGLTLFLRA